MSLKGTRMSESSYQQYLLKYQYKNAQNLNARIQVHARFSTNKYDWHRWVFDHFNIPAQGRILEVGCGPGGLWVSNLDRIPEDWEITLSDFSPGILEQAQHNLRNCHRHFAFEQFDVQSIPFEDGRFDVAVAKD